MPDDAPAKPTRFLSFSWTYWILWICFVVFIVYPLSAGPVFRLINSGVLPETTFVMYAPLQYLYESSDFAHDAIDWYLDLWGAK